MPANASSRGAGGAPSIMLRAGHASSHKPSPLQRSHESISGPVVNLNASHRDAHNKPALDVLA